MRFVLNWPSNSPVSNNPQSFPVFVRSDTVVLKGEITATDGISLATPVVAATVLLVNSDGTKSNAWEAVGTLTEVSEDQVYRVTVPLLPKAATASYLDGSAFVFDVEVTTTLERKTIKSGFKIEEDYTV